MSRRVLKWQIPVDDQHHPIGPGPVVLVTVQGPGEWRSADGLSGRGAGAPVGVVTVWTDEWDTDGIPPRAARAYGTGQPVPPGDVHLGSCLDGPLVWHVFAVGRDGDQA